MAGRPVRQADRSADPKLTNRIGETMTRTICSAIIAACLAVSAVAAPPPVTHPTSFEVAAVDQYLAQRVQDEGALGLSVAIVRNGQVVMAKGYGKAAINGPLAGADTAFGIGSVTKQFTSACILLLAEDGKLSVRDPVAKYFPQLTRAADITLYELLTHTSGYPDYYPLDF